MDLNSQVVTTFGVGEAGLAVLLVGQSVGFGRHAHVLDIHFPLSMLGSE